MLIENRELEYQIESLMSRSFSLTDFFKAISSVCRKRQRYYEGLTEDGASDPAVGWKLVADNIDRNLIGLGG